MSENKKKSRRKFLIRGGLGTLGLLAFGTYVFRNPLRRGMLEMVESLIPPYSGSGTEANLWFEITSDNNILLHSPKVEMGQGTFTGLAQMVADELDVNIDQVQVIGAATITGIIDGMSTGGSLSIASLWLPLREMAATIREFIKQEAAKKMGVAADALATKDGVVTNGNQSMTFAEVVADLTEWNLPATPALRPLSQYQYVGKPIKRIDLEAKVFGDPVFGIDATLPGMLHASVIRPEHVGATFLSADTSKAEQMPGVVKIVQMDNWVGVIAESFAQALAARRTIKVDWDIPKQWTEEDLREMLQVGKGSQMVTQKIGSALDAKEEGVVSMEFRSPIGAHAQMEPNGALAEVKEGKATVIISTQVVGITQKQVADALGLDLDQVNIIPTYLGGGFGRRLNTNHAVVAAQLSKAVGKPVKYFFTRKEEFQHDLFRPPTHHIMKGKLNDEGLLEGLEHHYASGDVAINSLLMPGALNTMLGTDVGAMRGGNLQYDKVPNHRAVQWHTTLPFATSWWRSLGLLANTFAIESFIDEMALKAGKNPIDFRLSQISDEGAGKRLKNCIQAVAEKAGYKNDPTNGRAMGIAASVDTNSAAAHVAEVSIVDNEIKVHKVTCALDCGLSVNPDQVIAQCEGAIMMGMSGAMHEKMTLKDGRLYPINYGPYTMTLMRDAPREIDVILTGEGDIPFPVGEPPMGPIGAAIANAVRRLTGQRLTELPLRLG